MNTFVTKSFAAGNGASQSALDVVLALLQTGNRIGVIAQKKFSFPGNLDGYALGNIETYKTAEFSALSHLHKKPTPQTMLWRMAQRFSINHRRLAKIGRIKNDLAFVNSFSAHRFWVPIYKTLKWPGVLIVRESPRHLVLDEKSSAAAGPLDHLNYYQKFIFVSSNVMKEWIELKPGLNALSTYIPNCAHEGEIKAIKKIDKREIRHQVGLKNDAYNVVCVGNLKYRKGQDVLINSMPQLIREIPEIRLTLVGSRRGDFAKQLIKTCRGKNYGDRVIFPGTRRDALKFIFAADTLVLPSRAEALPRVILEAMLLGTPIVATSVDGIPELIDDHESGILFRPDDQGGLVAGLKKLYQNHSLESKLAQNAEQKYWANFSRALQIERYQKFLRENSVS